MAIVAPTIEIRTIGPVDLQGLPKAAEKRHSTEVSLLDSKLRDCVHWLCILEKSQRHVPYLLKAVAAERTVGILPLALVSSSLFGRFLVSLPYINSAGVAAETADAAQQLLDAAVELADELDVRYLELRHELPLVHPAFAHTNDTKVVMRLQLPVTSEQLWAGFKSKLRSQIRSGERHPFEIRWGAHECLDDFYKVFSRNMRDLGTPVYSRRLFSEILARFADRAEICSVRLKERPIAAALLIHGEGMTEVPSASSLREFNSTSVNMVMYWHLLRRAIERGQGVFDFGRSTIDGSTYQFKKQWGATPSPSPWQYYLRRGTISDMRPGNSRFGMAVQLWRRLPMALANLLGPSIIRGIP